MYQIVLSSAALHDLQESYDWYEARLLGLGEVFIDNVEASINAITTNAEGYPIKFKTYREIVVNKFPFVIIYEIVKESNVINIPHIFHTSQNPARKY
ncbi:MAG: type II toxin-antitoxin system RelE/ParE family toxin [Mucilaginibacter sp.]